MTTLLKSSVCFGVDWATIPPEVAAKVPLSIADAGGGMHIVKDREGNTPLHWAAIHSSPEVVAALTKAGASPNEENNDGDTPLHLVVAHSKNMEVIDALAGAGAEHRENNNEETPLMMAVEYDNVELAEALIEASYQTPRPPRALGEEKELDGYIGRTGTSIFWIAKNVGSAEIAEAAAHYVEVMTYFGIGMYLLLRNEDDYTPLQCAVLADNAAAITGFICVWEHYQAWQHVYDNKVEQGAFDDPILHFAVSNGAECETVKALIDAGVDVNCLDRGGRTVLDCVESDDSDDDVAKVLVAAGAVRAADLPEESDT
ncbi:MAG: ankyrin repeat domain-containing protein [Gammaproteobacteria bacterium]